MSVELLRILKNGNKYTSENKSEYFFSYKFLPATPTVLITLFQVYRNTLDFSEYKVAYIYIQGITYLHYKFQYTNCTLYYSCVVLYRLATLLAQCVLVLFCDT